MSEKTTTAVIVSGARTPFVRAFKEYLKMDTIDLGVKAVKGLLEKSKVPYNSVDALYWGSVIIPSSSPNVGREVALEAGLPPGVESFTVTRACSSSLVAITQAVAAIERGEADVIIAGGSDSTSNAEVPLPRRLMQTLAPVAMNSKAGPMDWLRMLPRLAPFYDLLPTVPRVAERSTGELMGEASERMAKRNNISRKSQDEFAFTSHKRAAAALSSGRFDSEVIPVETASGKTVYSDTIIKGDTSMEKLSRLRAAFVKGGTQTAGNSSALTDGAAAVLIMSKEKATELGLKPLASIVSWDYSGVDPADQLLIGPAISMPAALQKAGLTLEDMDFVDIHEAFAAQVLSVLKAMESDSFAKERLGMDKAPGKIASEKLNIHGGSISLGHPFGATGARMVTTMANELSMSGKNYALLGICAAGGLGAGAVLKREE